MAAVLLVGALAPVAAYAAEYTVDSTGDQVDETPGSGGCKTAVNTCTLRAAIEESNANPSGFNEGNLIKFEFGTFDGQLSSTIELGSPLPTITQKVKLKGSGSPYQCKTAYDEIPGPCTGINGPAGETAFRVSAKGVDLTGFAISGAKTGIEVASGPGLFMWNNWLGLKLDGNAGPLQTGVFVDQNSNGATIGGYDSEARNIFADDNGAGVNIDGADFTEVVGDGFGVLPDGASPAPNGTNIEVGDAASGENRTARDNWIGSREGREEPTGSTICAGFCNVIAAAARSGIDLDGGGVEEGPATGSTRILNNYIGLDAFGAPLPNAQYGVHVGAAIGAMIGGPLPGDRNLIGGGIDGVLAGSGGGQTVIEGNWIGVDPTGTKTLDPPSAAGIAVGGSNVEVIGNRLSMVTGTAIETTAYETLIRGNAVGEGSDGGALSGGAVGVFLPSACDECGLIAGNSIAHASEFGVSIEGSWNHVYGNRIEASGDAGVHIEKAGFFGGAFHNLIGGDGAAEENTISQSGGPAIEIVEGVEFGANRRDEVARNNGSSNAGPFIALVNGANGAIQPPHFSSSTKLGASGTAAPGATIRIFRKAGASPGEIASFLAETVADKAGAWTVSYPSSIPAGTMVAASQTTEEDGTSEFAFSATAAEREEPGSGGGAVGDNGGGRGGGLSQHLANDSTPPRSVIFQGPRREAHSGTAKFGFESSEPGSHFQCKLDHERLSQCRSPKTYMKLKPGWHMFKVWAIDASGNRARVPARWKFHIL